MIKDGARTRKDTLQIIFLIIWIAYCSLAGKKMIENQGIIGKNLGIIEKEQETEKRILSLEISTAS